MEVVKSNTLYYFIEVPQDGPADLSTKWLHNNGLDHTSDPLEAMRFTDKSEAQEYRNINFSNYIVTEHEFFDDTKKDELVNITEFKQDENAINIARVSANYLLEHVSKNWFTALTCAQKLRIDFSEAIVKLNALKLFGFIYERKLKGKETEYKVTLSLTDRKKLVDDDIDFYSKKVEILKRESERLDEQITLESQK